MVVIEQTIKGPVNMVISKKAGRGPKIFLNDVDVSAMTIGYEILFKPGDLQILKLHIPISSIQTIEE